MDQLWLQSAIVSAPHALSCAAGYNIRWLLQAIARFGLNGYFYAFWIVVAMLAQLLQAVRARATLMESVRTT